MPYDFIFILILLIHFLADFGLQTHEQAIGKSEGLNFFNINLFYHVGVYTLIWMLITFGIFMDSRCITFGLITFITHYVTDYATSRIGKPFWAKQDLHNGFVVIGFDQVLHLLQLWFTFKLFI